MVAYTLMFGTETQLIGHIPVPYLLGFFRCLECPRASFIGCLSSRLSFTEWHSLTSSPHCAKCPCQGAVGWKIHFLWKIHTCLPTAINHPTISALLYPDRRRDFTVKPEPGDFTPARAGCSSDFCNQLRNIKTMIIEVGLFCSRLWFY